MKNRDFRIELYKERAEQDVQLQAAAEERELEGLIAGFQIECEKAALQYSHRIATEDSNVHRDAVSFCHRLAHSVVDMALEVARYRELRFGNFTPKQSIFDGDDNGVPAHVYGTYMTTLVNAPPVAMQPAVLDRHEFDQYASKQGRWTFDEEGDIDTATGLAALVQKVNGMSNPLPPPPPPPELPHFSICICILGKESTGKSSHAKALAAHYNLVVLSTENLVEVALASTVPRRLGELGNARPVFLPREGPGSEPGNSLVCPTRPHAVRAVS